MYTDIWQLALLSGLLALIGWWLLARTGRAVLALIDLLLPNRYLKRVGVRRVLRKESHRES